MVRKISDATSCVERLGNAGCMLVQGSVILLLAILLVGPILVLQLLVGRHVALPGGIAGILVLLSVTHLLHVLISDASSLS